MDFKRVWISYLFFGLGVCLTIWQYFWLLDHGTPLTPAMRQVFLIVVNTLAVWVGAILAYPWGVGTPGEERAPGLDRHYSWIKWISLIFCFISMLGIAVSLLQMGEAPARFDLGCYAVATIYMIGYGLLGIGPDVLRWYIRRLSAPPKVPDGPSAPAAPPKKKRIYPIASEFVIGRIRKPGPPGGPKNSRD